MVAPRKMSDRFQSGFYRSDDSSADLEDDLVDVA